MTLCSNDAKSCYNRIVLLIPALCMCQLGASRPSVLSMLDTIRSMHHHTHTVHGDSQHYTSHSTWAQLVTGIGQGNGAGHAIWAVVSSPLFAIIKEDGFLAMVSCAMMLMEKFIGGFAFVDDTDLCVLGQLMAEQDGITNAKVGYQLGRIITNNGRCPYYRYMFLVSNQSGLVRWEMAIPANQLHQCNSPSL